MSPLIFRAGGGVNPEEAKAKRARAAERKSKRAEKAKLLWRPKIKRKKKPGRKKVVRLLDSVFSNTVRQASREEIGHCAFCPNPIEQCFHFITRAKHSVRWDRRNAVGSCAGCNYRYEFDPHFAIRWYIDKFGLPAYEQLIADGNKIAKFSIADLRDKLEGFKLAPPTRTHD